MKNDFNYYQRQLRVQKALIKVDQKIIESRVKTYLIQIGVIAVISIALFLLFVIIS